MGWCAAPQFRGATIELLNHAGYIAGIHGYGTRLEQGAKVFFTGAQCFLSPLAFGDVARDLGCADDAAGGIPERRHG